MSRCKLAATLAVVLSTLMIPAIYAQDRGPDPYSSGPMLIPTQVPEYPVGAGASRQGMPQSASYRKGQDTGMAPTPIDANQDQGAGAAPVQQQGYVRLGAGMYPTPRPNIPIWAGSTMITNQAFAPQEMLYPHTYKAIYPPFYHRVKGGWILTPLGVRSHEKWELQGTMVQVKYRSSYPGLFSGAAWHPPATSYMHGAWR